MAKWINRTLVQAPRNNTTSHTISFTPATAGNLLVLVLDGAVTHTVPTGWLRRAQALQNTELSVYTKTATAGESSFSTTHNGSNYPIAALVYEFPSGSTWVNGVSSNAVGQDGANPELTGLTGTNLLFGVVDTPSSAQPIPTSCAWSGVAGLVEDVDVAVPFANSDGYALSVAYVEDSTATSFAPTGQFSGTALVGKEALTFAVNVPNAAPNAVRIVSSTVASGLATVAATKPTGSVAGDLLLAFQTAEWDTAAEMTAPTGWTLVGLADAGTNWPHTKVWRADGSVASTTFTAGPQSDSVVSILRIAGHDPAATPTFAGASSTTAQTSQVLPSVVPASSTDLLLCALGTEMSGAATTHTEPSGMTRVQYGQTAGLYSGLDVASQSLSSGVATGTRSFTTSAAVTWAGVTVAVKPASVTPVATYISAESATTPKTTSVTTAVGDLLVVYGLTADSPRVLATPTGGTGLTWTLRQSVTGIGSRGNAYVWTAVATTAQTFTLSIAASGTTGGTEWTFGCLRYAVGSHNGIGGGGAANGNGAPSLTFTATGSGSGIVVANVDWDAVAPGTPVWRTGAGPLTQTQAVRGGGGTYYSGYHSASGAAGSKTVGLTAPANQAYSIVAVEVLPPNPSISTLTDDFATADSAKWLGYDANSQIVGGQLVQQVTSGYDAGINSQNVYSLVASSADVQLVQRPNVGNGSTEASFRVAADDTNYLGWYVTETHLYAERSLAGTRTDLVALTYNAATHQRFRIRESGGTAFFDTYDGTTWTQRASWVISGLDVTAVKPTFIAGYWGTEPSPGTAIWDNFNVPPGGALNKTKVGTTTVSKAYYGATAVSKIYLGSTQIFP